MSEEIAARIEENEAIKSFIAHRDAGDLCDTSTMQEVPYHPSILKCINVQQIAR